jgi:hypothetical protein
VPKGLIPASFTVSETVGRNPVADTPASELAPAVTATNSSSAVGSIAEWILPDFVPLIGGICLVQSVHGRESEERRGGIFSEQHSGTNSFGSRTISLPPDSSFQFPDFPCSICFGITLRRRRRGCRARALPKCMEELRRTCRLPQRSEFFYRLSEYDCRIHRSGDGIWVENISPDSGKFGWQISGAASKAGVLAPLKPAVQAGDFNPHFPLPPKPSVSDYYFNLAISAVEMCQSDATKMLSGTAAKAVVFQVKKYPGAQ